MRTTVMGKSNREGVEQLGEMIVKERVGG